MILFEECWLFNRRGATDTRWHQNRAGQDFKTGIGLAHEIGQAALGRGNLVVYSL
jgi:hypothetical protein